MNVLYLDIDRVLNTDSDRHENGYLPMARKPVWRLNEILAQIPDLKLVITSAWRYHVLSNRMTIQGFEELMMHFGVNAHGRLAGTTKADPFHYGDPETALWTPEDWHREGLKWRRTQIEEDYAHRSRYRQITGAAMDDLPLGLFDELLFVQTDRETGITNREAQTIVTHFLAAEIGSWESLPSVPSPTTHNPSQERSD